MIWLFLLLLHSAVSVDGQSMTKCTRHDALKGTSPTRYRCSCTPYAAVDMCVHAWHRVCTNEKKQVWKHKNKTQHLQSTVTSKVTVFQTALKSRTSPIFHHAQHLRNLGTSAPLRREINGHRAGEPFCAKRSSKSSKVCWNGVSWHSKTQALEIDSHQGGYKTLEKSLEIDSHQRIIRVDETCFFFKKSWYVLHVQARC